MLFQSYWLKEIDVFIRRFNVQTPIEKLMTATFLTLLTALFKMSSFFIPVLGLFISALATLPIVLAASLGIKYVFLTYCSSFLLLMILQPSETIVFAFSTGILGVGYGMGLYFFKKRILVILSGAMSLCFGIIFVMAILQFPLLGPVVFKGSFFQVGLIFGFSFIYTWLYLHLITGVIEKLRRL